MPPYLASAGLWGVLALELTLFARRLAGEAPFANYATEVALPVGLAVGLAAWQSTRARFSVRWAAVHLLFLAAALVLTRPSFSATSPAELWAVAAATALTALTLVPALREVRLSRIAWLLPLGFGPVLGSSFGAGLAEATGLAAYGLVRAAGQAASHHLCSGHLVLTGSAFTLAITESCAGLKGVLLFWFLFSLLVQLDLVPRGRVAGAALAGIALMLTLNAFRIALLFWAGSRLTETLGDAQSAKDWVETVHTHLGWVLYGIGLSLLLPQAIRRPISEPVTPG
jgi:exosortase/archaeosortase family protein